MAKAYHPRHFRERNVVRDKRHRWPVVSPNGVIVGMIELQGRSFAAYSISGEAIGRFHSLSDAREACLLHHSQR